MIDWFDEHPLIGTVSLIVVVFLFVIGIAWFGASQKAASYRKYCDTPVTTWDALWLDLRIDECGR